MQRNMRNMVLAKLRGNPGTVLDLVTRTGLHAQTVRRHVRALVADGTVVQCGTATDGVGRPADLYRIVE